jgi:hypothetical protein
MVVSGKDGHNENRLVETETMRWASLTKYIVASLIISVFAGKIASGQRDCGHQMPSVISTGRPVRADS